MLEIKQELDALINQTTGVKVSQVNKYREEDEKAIIFLGLKEGKELTREIIYTLGIVGEQGFFDAIVEKLKKSKKWEKFSALRIIKKQFYFNETLGKNIFTIDLKINQL